MRYKMKHLSIALSVVFLLAAFLPMNVFAAATPLITGSAVEAQLGEKVEVVFQITHADAVCGGNFNIVYDSEYLQVVSAKAGAVFTGSTPVINTKYASGKVRITWAGLSPLESSGEIIRVEFLVKNGAPSGNLDVGIENLKLYDIHTEPVEAKAEGAQITVKNTYLSLHPENNGENISVGIWISGDTEFQGGNYTLLYDNTALEPVSVSKGTLLSGTTLLCNSAYASDAVRVSWAGIEAVAEKGELCKVIFKAKTDAETTVRFSLKDVQLYDAQGKPLVVQTQEAELVMEAVDAQSPRISVETVKCENEGVLSVCINENSMLCGGGIEIKYDNTLVDIVGAEAGDVLQDKSPAINTAYEENIIKVSWASALPMTKAGALLNITFTIKEEVRGFAAFEVNAQSLYGENMESVTAICTGGGVTIDRAPIAKKGDIYADDVVNTKDAIMLAQYLAEWDVVFTDATVYAADVHADGFVNTKDAIKLAQYLAEWDVTLE